MPLLSTLDDSREKEKGKVATKDKYTKFFDLLDEVKERHLMTRVLNQNDEMEDEKDSLVEEVVRLVVPSLQRFMTKNREKEFSKSECPAQRNMGIALIVIL